MLVYEIGSNRDNVVLSLSLARIFQVILICIFCSLYTDSSFLKKCWMMVQAADIVLIMAVIM